MKHTAGPWRIRTIHNKYFNSITAFEVRDQSSHLGLLIASVNQGAGEHEANAHLLAAAPELLKVLKTTKQQLEHHIRHNIGINPVDHILGDLLKEIADAIELAEPTTTSNAKS